MKTILVTGSSGFIGGHLTKRLKADGHYVVGADIEKPKYTWPSIYLERDLRKYDECSDMFLKYKFDEVYNLACLMGGMGWIGSTEHSYDIMIGSSQIVTNIIDCCVVFEVPKIFYSSSACVYNLNKQERVQGVSLKESDAYPALPDLVYGWQKLFGEREHLAAAESTPLQVRIARFHNIFGEEGTYEGGKEKAPAALCRKVAQARDGDFIEVWGDGQQTRSFLHVNECIEGTLKLMESDYQEPLNIGSDESISINDLAYMIMRISGKDLTIKNIPGIQGVRGRNSDNTLCKQVLGWAPSATLESGIRRTYSWINGKVIAKQFRDYKQSGKVV